MRIQKVLFLCGMAMAASLDFSFGALLVALIGEIMGKVVSIWSLVVGGVLALSPDITEIAKTFFTKDRQLFSNGHHENWDHWPLLMVPIGTLLSTLIGGEYWGIVAFLSMLFHYNHDMEFGKSGGIAFFAPLDQRFFAWWKGFYDPKTSAMYLKENELEPWLLNWLQPSKLSIVELTIGSISISCAMSIVFGVAVGLFMFLACWTSILLVWEIQKRTSHEL